MGEEEGGEKLVGTSIVVSASIPTATKFGSANESFSGSITPLSCPSSPPRPLVSKNTVWSNARIDRGRGRALKRDSGRKSWTIDKQSIRIRESNSVASVSCSVKGKIVARMGELFS